MRNSCSTSSISDSPSRLARLRPVDSIRCAAMQTRITAMLGIEHPVVLGGMGSGTSPELVVAVSNSGGLGVQGCAGRSPAQIAGLAEQIRVGVGGHPFGLNLLLFLANEGAI